jgi:hypothetical protein
LTSSGQRPGILHIPRPGVFIPILSINRPAGLEIIKDEGGIHLFHLQRSLVGLCFFFNRVTPNWQGLQSYKFPHPSLKKNFLARLACIET